MNRIESNNRIVMDGRKFAEQYEEKILNPRCVSFKENYGRLPKLATVMVGDNPSSESYLRIKDKFFSKLKLESEIFRFTKDVSENELINLIETLNKDHKFDGILIQVPLPNHIDTDRIIESISPLKDVEGLSPKNIYAWAKDIPNLVPATSLGVIAILKYYQIPLEGKHAVIVGRSIIVGKPLFHLLLKENCTVTVCHSRTKALEKYTRQADILIAAVGKAQLIKANMVKDRAVVIDVGVNYKNGKLVGDVDFEQVEKRASFITPVPGGAGPVTVSMLAGNLLLAAELRQANKNEEQIRCLREYYENYVLRSNINYC
ncbi:MAG: bifunctional 5,10-methylenetetrahydrofolate dehydrogenase/5,10-methenyltetrahydrofolate cyclohydrolase [Candidatus Heimdallarchaeaceae archaeon]